VLRNGLLDLGKKRRVWNNISNGQWIYSFYNFKLKGSVWVRVKEDSLKRISEVVYRVECLGVQRFRKKSSALKNEDIYDFYPITTHYSGDQIKFNKKGRARGRYV
jgi:hypothetical protein